MEADPRSGSIGVGSKGCAGTVGSGEGPKEASLFPMRHNIANAIRELWAIVVLLWTKLPRSASFWTAAATIVIAFTTLVQWTEMRKATRAAQESADAAKSAADIASAGLRPWIKIKSVELRKGIGPIKTLAFHWFPTGAAMPPVIQVRASVVNVGHSVAQDVEIIPELFFGRFVSDKWHDVVSREEERFCRSAANQVSSSAASIIFPSESSESNMGVGGIVHDTDTMRTPGSPLTHSAASLILCVNYRGAPTTQYQTEAWFGLYEDNLVLIAIGVDGDASHLRLIRDENGDHAN